MTKASNANRLPNANTRISVEDPRRRLPVEFWRCGIGPVMLLLDRAGFRSWRTPASDIAISLKNYSTPLLCTGQSLQRGRSS